MNNTKSHMTAITRRKISAPMRRVKDFLTQPSLDYGCGKGFDADSLGQHKYDPHYFPDRPSQKYDAISCNYVLNVLLPEEQDAVLRDIDSLLTEGGVAYITVRRDIKTDGFTRRGTYQRNVLLDLPRLEEKKHYCIYMMRKGIINKGITL